MSYCIYAARASTSTSAVLLRPKAEEQRTNMSVCPKVKVREDTKRGGAKFLFVTFFATSRPGQLGIHSVTRTYGVDKRVAGLSFSSQCRHASVLPVVRTSSALLPEVCLLSLKPVIHIYSSSLILTLLCCTSKLLRPEKRKKMGCTSFKDFVTPSTASPFCRTQHKKTNPVTILSSKRRIPLPQNPRLEGREQAQADDVKTWRYRCCIVDPMTLSLLWRLYLLPWASGP